MVNHGVFWRIVSSLLQQYLNAYFFESDGEIMSENKFKLCGYYNYTVVLTYIGMLTGLFGIVQVIAGEFRTALICLMVAGLCDMFDGMVASTKDRTENEKRFGVQIDSLSDLICFCVLPALLVYQACNHGKVVMIVGGLYVLCGLIRLAYFNVMEEERQKHDTGKRKYYLGLPVTSAALIQPLAFVAAGNPHTNGQNILVTVMALTAAAFVLPLHIKKPYFAGKIALVFTGVAEFVILLVSVGLNIQ